MGHTSTEPSPSDQRAPASTKPGGIRAPSAEPEPAEPEPAPSSALDLAIARAEGEGMVTEDAKVHAAHLGELPEHKP